MKKEEFRVTGADVLKKVKELIKAGNVRCVSLKNGSGKTVAEFPLTVGVAAAALLPVYAAIGAVAALLAKCTIVIEKAD